MTLRVYFDIVPFGIEDEAYPLHELDISNIGHLRGDEYEYNFKLDDIPSDETVTHYRSEGAIELVRKVLNTNWIRNEFETINRQTEEAT